jgi:hypothetical protein
LEVADIFERCWASGSPEGQDWSDVITLDPRLVQRGEDKIFSSTESKELVIIPPGMQEAEDQIEGWGREGERNRISI